MQQHDVAPTRPTAGIAIGLLVLSAAAALLWWYIGTAAVDVVYADTWAYLPTIEHALSGRLSAADLFAAHNQNRTPLLDVVLLASARYDAFDLVHVDYAGPLFIAATGMILLIICRSLFCSRNTAMAVTFTCVVLLLSSLGQWENLLLPINLVFFATITFSAASVVLVHRYLVDPQPRLLSPAFLGGTAMSVLALFCMAGGVVVWVVNSVQIAVSCWLHKTRTGPGVIAYGTAGGLSIAVYLHGLGQQAGGGFALSHPQEFGRFLLIGTGNALVGFFRNVPSVQLDLAVGAMLLACYGGVALIWIRLAKADQAATLGLLCLVLLGVGEEALIALGRLPYGARYAAASRYSTLTLVSVAAALIFLAWHAARSRSGVVMAVLLGTAVAAFSMMADWNELEMAGARRQYGENLKHILQVGDIGEAEAASLEWGSAQGGHLQDIVDGNAFLRRYRLSLYRNEP